MLLAPQVSAASVLHPSVELPTTRARPHMKSTTARPTGRPEAAAPPGRVPRHRNPGRDDRPAERLTRRLGAPIGTRLLWARDARARHGQSRTPSSLLSCRARCNARRRRPAPMAGNGALRRGPRRCARRDVTAQVVDDAAAVPSAGRGADLESAPLGGAGARAGRARPRSGRGRATEGAGHAAGAGALGRTG